MNAAALPAWLDWLLSALVLGGAGFALVGAIGLVRLPQFMQRLHAPTKATTLGVGCALLASIVAFSWAGARPALHEVLITMFLFLTAPVSAHLLARAALLADRQAPAAGAGAADPVAANAPAPGPAGTATDSARRG